MHNGNTFKIRFLTFFIQKKEQNVLFHFVPLELVGGLEPPTFCSPKKSFDFSGTPYQSHAVRLREISSPSVLNLFYTKKERNVLFHFVPLELVGGLEPPTC